MMECQEIVEVIITTSGDHDHIFRSIALHFTSSLETFFQYFIDLMDDSTV